MLFPRSNKTPSMRPSMRRLLRQRAQNIRPAAAHAHAPGQAANGAPVRDLRRVGIHPDYWYPLAWSHEVKRGKTHGVTFAGEPIVLARTESGKVFALEDRCAHRQVPLHQGVVEGESIRCGYHGWTYDCSGKCIDVPYLGRERLPNGVRSYPCRGSRRPDFRVSRAMPLWPNNGRSPRSARSPTRSTRRAVSAVR